MKLLCSRIKTFILFKTLIARCSVTQMTL